MNEAFNKGYKAGFNGVRAIACPHEKHSYEFWSWLKGHDEGAQAMHMVYAHEANLYKNDQPRMKMLWG